MLGAAEEGERRLRLRYPLSNVNCLTAFERKKAPDPFSLGTPQRSPGSRAYCFAACQGSSTTPSPTTARELAPSASVAFPQTEQGRHPDLPFSPLYALPTGSSIYASTAASRLPPQDSRPGWNRFSFPVGLFHPLQYAGLSRRVSVPGFPPGFPRFSLSFLPDTLPF